MEDLQILEWWAKFHNLPLERKRELLTKYLSKTGVSCEVRLYRSITRVSMQTFKQKLGRLLEDDLKVQGALKDIGINAMTAINWYIQTKPNVPLKVETSQCATCPLNGLCEYSVSPTLWKNVKDKYGYLLMSKRMQHVLIKKERFIEAVRLRMGLTDESVIQRLLRRVMEKQYYKKDLELTGEQQTIAEVLLEQKVTAIAVIKWFYIVKEAKQSLARVARNEMTPAKAELIGIESLGKDLRNLEVKE